MDGFKNVRFMKHFRNVWPVSKKCVIGPKNQFSVFGRFILIKAWSFTCCCPHVRRLLGAWENFLEKFLQHDVREQALISLKQQKNWKLIFWADCTFLPDRSHVTFKTWNVSKMWHSKHGMSQKFDIHSMECLKNVRFMKDFRMFQKCDIQSMKCFRNMRFKIWNLSET